MFFISYTAFFLLGASRLQYVSEEYHKLPAYLIGHAYYMEGVIEEQKNTYESAKGKVTRYVFSLTQFSYKGENVRHVSFRAGLYYAARITVMSSFFSYWSNRKYTCL